MNLNERDDNRELENLVGGMSRAFRLMNLWTSSIQNQDRLSFSYKKDDFLPGFVRRARREGYSDEAIRFYASAIQGCNIPKKIFA